MAFGCPDCGKCTVAIVSRIELRSDSKWDEIALQLIRCNECGFKGIATNQENRWGAMDSEVVHHHGYHVEPELWQSLKTLIETCLERNSDHCTCASCEKLNACDENGVWNWLAREGNAEQIGRIFKMRLW